METHETQQDNQSTQPPAPNAKILTKNIRRELMTPLSDEHLLEVATVKADLEAELEELEEQFADTKRDWGKRIDECEKRISHLGGEIRARARKSVVICHERVDPITRMVETVREDTGIVVDRRVANLFEAAQVLPPTESTKGDKVDAPGDEDDDAADASLEDAQREAAAAKRDTNVEENEDGDVVPPESEPKKGKRSKKK